MPTTHSIGQKSMFTADPRSTWRRPACSVGQTSARAGQLKCSVTSVPPGRWQRHPSLMLESVAGDGVGAGVLLPGGDGGLGVFDELAVGGIVPGTDKQDR